MTSMIFFLIFIPILSFVLLGINFLLAPHNPYKEKKTPFECGYHSFLSQNRTQFTISFFIFALLFLIFDLEIVLIYPYTVSSYANNSYGLIVMILFTLIVTVGFIFELGKGALKIESKQSKNIDSKNSSSVKNNNKSATMAYIPLESSLMPIALINSIGLDKLLSVKLYLIDRLYLDIRLLHIFIVLVINFFLFAHSLYINDLEFLLTSPNNSEGPVSPEVGDNSTNVTDDLDKGENSSGPNGSGDNPIILSDSADSGSDDGSEDSKWLDPDLCRCDHIKGEECPHCPHTFTIPQEGPPGRCCLCGEDGADKLCGETINGCECILHDICGVPPLSEDSSDSDIPNLAKTDINSKKRPLEDYGVESSSKKR